MSANFGHGQVGSREQQFSNLLPLRAKGYDTGLLLELSKAMASAPDKVKDGADPEENLWVPAGYTYFGQFIDHDLTFDNTSSLNPADDGKANLIPTNLRTPRFDLDSLYGDGPDANPFMYDEDGASLLFKDSFENQTQTNYVQARKDLLRSPNGRAIIGDKRNDENSIVNQIHLTFIKYHNAVVKKLKGDDSTLSGTLLFEKARNAVRWTYQKLVIEDFLPRIVKAEVLQDLRSSTQANRQYALYTEDKRSNLPREFVVAAYRFGHSGVRFGYRLNRDTRRSIFPATITDPSSTPDDQSLLGFDPLPKSHVIDDWGRFFPSTKPDNIPDDLGPGPKDKKKEGDGLLEDPAVRLQFAYKLDPTLVDPLSILPPTVLPTSDNPGGALQEVKDTIKPDTLPDPNRPSLALLNLLRGNRYLVQGGQAIAKVLKEKGFPVEPLEAKYLVTRNNPLDDKGDPIDGTFQFNPISSIDLSLETDTPLWFYILAEGQKNVVDKVTLGEDGTFSEDVLKDPCIAKTQLGWVGGRIIAEVFYGLLDSDPESLFNAAPKDWVPLIGNKNEIVFADLLKFAGEIVSPSS